MKVGGRGFLSPDWC